MAMHKLQRYLIFALLFTGALLLVFDLLLNRKSAVPVQSLNTFTVVRATSPLPRGTLIRPHDVVVSQASSAPPPGAVTQAADVSGRITTRDIAASDVLSSENTGRGPAQLAQLIPQGMRAVAVRVTDELAVANLIRPGDRVDVLVISNGVRAQRGEEKPFPDAEVRTFLQNVRVLAVGETVVGQESNAKDYRNVTLAVSPKEAGMIALARSIGTQYLSLRATDDPSETTDPPALSTGDLRLTTASRADEAAPGAHPPARSVEVISGPGTSRENIVVPESGRP